MENVKKLSGTPINDLYQITLRNSKGMKVEILNVGGIIKSIFIPDRDGVNEEVLLGYNNLADYFNRDYFPFGSLQCRVPLLREELITKDRDTSGVRNSDIANANFTRKLEQNSWSIVSVDGTTLKLLYNIDSYTANEQGISQILVTYRVTPDNTLHLEYLIASKNEFALNINHLCYFNLSSCKQTLKDHTLLPGSGRFIKSNTKEVLFTGAGNSGRDHQEVKEIGMEALNHYWLANRKDQNFKMVASLFHLTNGRKLKVFSADNTFHISSIMPAKGKDRNIPDKLSGIHFATKSFATRIGNQDFRRPSDRPFYHTEIKYKFSVE